MNVADGGQSSQGSKKMISAHLNGSVTFTLQALAIWALVALPGNIVTLVLLNKEPASTSTFVTALGPVRQELADSIRNFCVSNREERRTRLAT